MREREVKSLEQVAIDALYILKFHTIRCPLDIMHNFSGHEEHLAMYRRVIQDLESLVGDRQDEVDFNNF